MAKKKTGTDAGAGTATVQHSEVAAAAVPLAPGTIGINLASLADAVAMDPDMFIVQPELNTRFRSGNGHAYTDVKFKQTKESVKNVGILQPILFDMTAEGNPRVRAGFRRLEIVKQLRLEHPDDPRFNVIPAVPLTSPDAKLLLEANIAENDSRKDLSAMDYARIIRMNKDAGLTQAAIATMLRRTGGWVSKRLKLLELSPALQDQVEAGELDADAAYDLVSKGEAVQTAVAEQIEENKAAAASETAAGAGNAGKQPKKITRAAVKSARVVKTKGKGKKPGKKLKTDTTWSRIAAYKYFAALAVDKKANKPLQTLALAIQARLDGKISDKVLRGRLVAVVRPK